MISAADFVHLPYTPDLTDGGIVYAGRIFAHLRSPGGRGLYDTVRRVVAATALELAFRRYLTAQGVSFGVKTAVPFADPDQYSVEIGGRTCALKAFLISQPQQIDAITADPDLALSAPALVPRDRFAAEMLRSEDVYLFAFVSATSASGGAGKQAPRLPEDSTYWIHGMPPAWIRPRVWAPLGPLRLKSEAPGALQLELAGQDESRRPKSFLVDLPPGRIVEVEAAFHSISHAHAMTRPLARIGVSVPARRLTHVISTEEWQDIWLLGVDICMLGWITREQFRLRAREVPERRHVFQFTTTKTKNLAVDVANLKPIHQLLERARGGGL